MRYPAKGAAADTAYICLTLNSTGAAVFSQNLAVGASAVTGASPALQGFESSAGKGPSDWGEF